MKLENNFNLIYYNLNLIFNIKNLKKSIIIYIKYV